MPTTILQTKEFARVKLAILVATQQAAPITFATDTVLATPTKVCVLLQTAPSVQIIIPAMAIVLGRKRQMETEQALYVQIDRLADTIKMELPILKTVLREISVTLVVAPQMEPVSPTVLPAQAAPVQPITGATTTITIRPTCYVLTVWQSCL